MAHPFHHALSSVRKWGGRPEDYQPLHDWFDESKAHLGDFRHRALRHHSEGIFMLERFFGTTIINSDGKEVPVRLIGEQHVIEDLGRIPTWADWARLIRPEAWMGRAQRIDATPRDPARFGDADGIAGPIPRRTSTITDTSSSPESI